MQAYVKKCPECSGINLFWNKDRGEIICRDCGLVVEEKMDGVELEFRHEALIAVAKSALERKIGARGLRSVLEHVLLDIMYDLPSLNGVSKVVIDEATIKGESTPLLIFDNADQLHAASDHTGTN